jgi:hypothetical protein
MLPHADRAVIAPEKVRDYLLSKVHPVGRFKSVVFSALGYRAEEWERLRDDLLALARTGVVSLGRASTFGQRYEVTGILSGPNGREARFVSVWMLPAENEPPRFITAVPE